MRIRSLAPIERTRSRAESECGVKATPAASVAEALMNSRRVTEFEDAGAFMMVWREERGCWLLEIISGDERYELRIVSIFADN